MTEAASVLPYFDAQACADHRCDRDLRAPTPSRRAPERRPRVGRLHSASPDRVTDLRSRFVNRFGDDLSETIERVAEHHTKVLPASLDRGSDPFQFALVWAIGFQCLTRPEFRLEQCNV